MIANKVKVDSVATFDIFKLKGYQEVGNHGFVEVFGYVDENIEKVFNIETIQGNNTEVISLVDEEGTRTKWFDGVIKNYKIYTENERKILKLTLATGTFLMDSSYHFRSFQSESISYEDIFSIIHKGYAEGGTIINANGKNKIDSMIMQYMETDFEFAKRLASHFNLAIVPDARFSYPTYYVGFPKQGIKATIQSSTYTTKKDIDSYINKIGKGLADISENDLIVYEYISRDVLMLGDLVEFNGKQVYVSKIESELLSAELIHKYTFISSRGAQVPMIYNNNLIGLSLSGNITSVNRTEVMIRIDDDENMQNTGVRLYPYATPYSTDDGTGWYFMPEIEDKIALHFPTEKEGDVYVANSVHIGAHGGRSNSSNKSLKNKQHKEVLFTPTSIKVTNNAGMSVELDDNKGIEIISNKAINIKSSSNIEIKSNTDKVSITAPNEIIFKQGNTEMDLKEKLSFKGAQIRLD
ncbi:MAG: hypothetical protein R3Y24_02765 [Eubacteriales bacterium]